MRVIDAHMRSVNQLVVGPIVYAKKILLGIRPVRFYVNWRYQSDSQPTLRRSVTDFVSQDHLSLEIT